MIFSRFNFFLLVTCLFLILSIDSVRAEDSVKLASSINVLVEDDSSDDDDDDDEDEDEDEDED